MTRELEEMEREEEKQQQSSMEVDPLSDSVLSKSMAEVKAEPTDTSDIQMPDIAIGDNVDQEEEEEADDDQGGIVFMDTGVINVAHCNEIADSYKVSRQNYVKYYIIFNINYFFMDIWEY